MGRRKKIRKKAHKTGTLLLLAGLFALGIGLYIKHELDRYGALQAFAPRERGWRDNSFEVALWAGGIGFGLILLVRLFR